MRAADEEYVEYVTSRLPTLRRLGYQLCGTSTGADDLVQETITRLFVGWRRIRAADNLDGYVRTMLVRAFLAERRRPWSRVARFDTPPPQPDIGAPDTDLALVLRAALAHVPPRQRAVLVLRFICDLPVDEVAQHLSCSNGTVKSQTSHGLAALRRLLATPAFAGTTGFDTDRERVSNGPGR
jgi:RNA polymerase sigma-70 factor (sigma-E family)